MARQVTVRCLGTQGRDEELVRYPVGIPNDVLFFTKDGIVYASWWDISSPPSLIQVPASQLVCID